LEADYVLSQTNFNRRVAAQREVEAVAAAYETDTITLDVLLKAQQSLAQAESDYYRAIVNYNRDISQVHYRKGSLLEYNGVYLAEGPWTGKAYFDARRRARARAAATFIDYGFTRPRVMSRGPVNQRMDESEPVEDIRPGATGTPTPAPTSSKPDSGKPDSNKPELVPTPEPESIQPNAMPSAQQPTTDSQTSNSGGGPAADRWSVASDTSAATPKSRIVDTQVAPTSWANVERGNNDESGANAPPVATHRVAAGWSGLQY
jgi:hypothetical protein